MPILITGGAGFIGSHLAIRLLNQQHQVTVVDDFHPYYDVSRKMSQLELVKRAGDFSFQRENLTDESVCERIFKEQRYETVYNLAALPGVAYSFEAPHAYIDHNLKATANVLKWAGETGASHVVFASSSSVYGDHEGMPLHESMARGEVISPYAATKVGGEALCQAYQHSYNYKLTIARFFTVYGPWGRPDMAITKFIGKLLRNEEIDIYGEGTARDYTFISDIIDGLEAFMKVSEPKGIYNLGYGKPVTMWKLLDELGHHFPQMKVNWLPYRLGDVKQTWSDISKARENLGYEPKVSIKEGLAQTVEWARRHPDQL
jgi:UDP-glucuronate 4-epimerase